MRSHCVIFLPVLCFSAFLPTSFTLCNFRLLTKLTAWREDALLAASAASLPPSLCPVWPHHCPTYALSLPYSAVSSGAAYRYGGGEQRCASPLPVPAGGRRGACMAATRVGGGVERAWRGWFQLSAGRTVYASTLSSCFLGGPGAAERCAVACEWAAGRRAVFMRGQDGGVRKSAEKRTFGAAACGALYTFSRLLFIFLCHFLPRLLHSRLFCACLCLFLLLVPLLAPPPGLPPFYLLPLAVWCCGVAHVRHGAWHLLPCAGVRSVILGGMTIRAAVAARRVASGAGGGRLRDGMAGSLQWRL